MTINKFFQLNLYVNKRKKEESGKVRIAVLFLCYSHYFPLLII